MRRTKIPVCVLIASVFLSTRAFAWNATGHMTAALIAYRRLDDQQKQQVAAILKSHPHYKLYLSADVPQGVSEDEWAFLRASVWPDFVRPSRPGDPQFKDATITHFHQGPWHYVTIPFVPKREREHLDPTTLPTKPEPNILTALDENARKLGAPDAKPEDRAVALAWLEHLVGDVHQPLHAVSLFSAEYPAGDKGGNDQAIRADGVVINLHAYWDDLLGTGEDYAVVDFLATQIAADPSCDPARLAQYKSDTSFSSWADESFNYAVSFAYLNGRLRTAPMQAYQSHAMPGEEVPALPASYLSNSRDLAKQRIALAGFRLADQIKAILR